MLATSAAMHLCHDFVVTLSVDQANRVRLSVPNMILTPLL